MTTEKVWVVDMTGSDGPWNRHNWQDVEDDIRDACKQTVLDCEQEINEGGRWTNDEACEKEQDALTSEVLALVRKQLRHGVGLAAVTVEPWYAKAQRCTYRITVRETTTEEVYGDATS